MADLRIVDAPVLLQESITDDVKMPTGGLGNYAIRLGDLVWYVVTKEQLASKSYVNTSSQNVQNNLDTHIADKANPHQVTKQQVGLGNVDNTADIDKPVSNAVSSAIITATTDMATKAYVNQKDNLKADKATTLSGYGITDAYTKSETYTKAEVDNKTIQSQSVDGLNFTTTLKDGTSLTTNLAGEGATGWSDLLITTEHNRTQRDKNNDFISTKDFGAVGDGVTDDSQALTDAIRFACDNKRPLDGLGLTYSCNNVLFDSNLQFINANLVCNKYDTDMISVLNSGESDEWLENVELINVKINGKRELHTNIKAQATSEDGGRHGFRIVRKTRNIRLTNCEAVNCAGDGIILYPKSGAGNNRIVDVVLTDCNFSGNRRHGGSSDSVNGIKFTRVKCNRNGLDIDANAPTNSGLRGDTFNGYKYGNGWDFEEYGTDLISTNIVLDDCEMLQNARSGLLFYNHGNTSNTTPKAVISISGGSYDKGQFNGTEYAIQYSILPSNVNGITNVSLFNVNGANLNGGDIGVTSIDVCNIYNTNCGQISALAYANVYTDLPASRVYKDTTAQLYSTMQPNNSDFQYEKGSIKQFAPTVEYRHYISDSGYAKFAINSGFSERGSIKLTIDGNGFGQISLAGNNGADFMMITRNQLYPVNNINYTLGKSDAPFSNIYLTNAPTVSSDERVKKDIRILNDAEKLVAKDLKAEICIYRLKANDEKLQIGMIAQKVVSIFGRHGLNALDYQVVHYDADIDRYSIVYEQLILFILFSL